MTSPTTISASVVIAVRAVDGLGGAARSAVRAVKWTSATSRGDTMTRIDGARRVSGVIGDAGSGGTLASRASAQPRSSEARSPGSDRRARVAAMNSR